VPDFVGRTEARDNPRGYPKRSIDTKKRNLLSTILVYGSLTVPIGAQMFFDVSYYKSFPLWL
jgi:hypothetical protein